jgi:chromosome segregation ATPase
MNGSIRNTENSLRTPDATPPRPTTSNNMPSYTTPRNVSGPLAVENALNGADGNAAWTRPNFHSTPSNSKTSQYIDKITSENDRLRRELKAEKLAREEEAKRVSAAKSKAEDSRADFQHLQVLADTNARAIERKDRKLDELKATLDAEVNRRKVAEQRAEEALKMLGDTRSETQRELSQAYEMKHMADTHLETARDGFKRITESYEKKLKYINEELNELRRKRVEDTDKIKRQAIISDQLQHEMSRTSRTETNLSHMMDAYKEEHRKEMDRLITEAEKMRSTLPGKEREAEELVEAMKETRDRMRWVITQQKRQDGTVEKPQETTTQRPQGTIQQKPQEAPQQKRQGGKQQKRK